MYHLSLRRWQLKRIYHHTDILALRKVTSPSVKSNEGPVIDPLHMIDPLEDGL